MTNLIWKSCLNWDWTWSRSHRIEAVSNPILEKVFLTDRVQQLKRQDYWRQVILAKGASVAVCRLFGWDAEDCQPLPSSFGSVNPAAC